MLELGTSSRIFYETWVCEVRYIPSSRGWPHAGQRAASRPSRATRVSLSVLPRGTQDLPSTVTIVAELTSQESEMAASVSIVISPPSAAVSVLSSLSFLLCGRQRDYLLWEAIRGGLPLH